MTLIVGVLCRDGVVMASDSAATFAAHGAPTIGQQEVRKIRRINDRILYASTGAIGMAQLLSDKIGALWDDKRLVAAKSPEAMMDTVGKEFLNLVAPYLQSGQAQRALTGDAGQSLCKSMVALPHQKVPCLFTFDYNGAPERCTAELPFVSMGSGQSIADPFLAFLRRLLWPETSPTIAEGRLAAVWTIDHVRKTNAGGVGGRIQLATLSASVTGSSVVEMTESDVDEHLQHIASAEQALVERMRLRQTVAGDPEPPRPGPDIAS